MKIFIYMHFASKLSWLFILQYAVMCWQILKTVFTLFSVKLANSLFPTQIRSLTSRGTSQWDHFSERSCGKVKFKNNFELHFFLAKVQSITSNQFLMRNIWTGMTKISVFGNFFGVRNFIFCKIYCILNWEDYLLTFDSYQKNFGFQLLIEIERVQDFYFLISIEATRTVSFRNQIFW